MKTSLHIGLVYHDESCYPVGSPEHTLLAQKFVWYVRNKPLIGTAWEYIGVCPQFDLVKTTKELPHYGAVFRKRADGDLEITFEKV